MASASSDLDFYYRCMLVDRNDLVHECEQQPHQHAKIGREAVLCASRLSAHDMQLKRAFAARARAIREKHAESKAVGRLTDAAVTAQIEGDRAYQTLVEQGAALKQALGQWQALREASKDRGFMVSKLCDVWIAGLMTPGEPRLSASAERAINYRENRNPVGDVEYGTARAAMSLARKNVLSRGPTTKTSLQRETI